MSKKPRKRLAKAFLRLLRDTFISLVATMIADQLKGLCSSLEYLLELIKKAF